MKKLTLIIILIFTVLKPAYLYADTNAESIFFKGNALYMQGKWEEALKEYEKITSNDSIISPPAYFNSGKANEKLGRKGMALYFYLKARKYVPRDKEINNRAKDMLKLQNIQFTPIADYFTKNELSAFILILVFITSITALFNKYRKDKKDFFWIYVISWGMIILTTSVLGLNIYKSSKKYAVSVTPSLEVRSSTGFDTKPFESIEEGKIIRVTGREGNWLKIKSPNTGAEGWIYAKYALIP